MNTLWVQLTLDRELTSTQQAEAIARAIVDRVETVTAARPVEGHAAQEN